MDLILATCFPLYYIVMRAERPILLRFLNVLASLNGFIIKRIVFLFLVKYIASGTLRFIFLIDNINLFRNYGLRAPSFKLLDFFFDYSTLRVPVKVIQETSIVH